MSIVDEMILAVENLEQSCLKQIIDGDTKFVIKNFKLFANSYNHLIELKGKLKFIFGETNNCEDIGLEHSWRHFDTNVCLTVYPPQFEPSQRQCINCDVRQKLTKTESWENIEIT